MKILISGATGLVGTALIKKLIQRGHHVNVLTRNKITNPNEFLWDLKKKYADEKAFENIDSIVHLSGATIAKKWTKSYKKEIINSRIESAKLLLDTAKRLNIRLKSYISSSGINYYGTFSSDKIFTENDTVEHQDFLSEVCRKWEASADEFSALSDRVIKMRTAPVFSKNGGSFMELQNLVNKNIASGIGSGKQFFPWIHIDDLVNIYILAIENENCNGAINALADEIPTNQELMKKLAKRSGKFFLPINVPSFVIQLVLGEMATMILEGSKASNQKIKSLGFGFLYPDLDSAFENLI